MKVKVILDNATSDLPCLAYICHSSGALSQTQPEYFIHGTYPANILICYDMYMICLMCMSNLSSVYDIHFFYSLI